MATRWAACPSPAACRRSAWPSPKPAPDTLAKLKKGKEANFIIYEAPGIGMPMKLSLEGFSASLAALDKASNAN